ncbi:hypothetical protein FB45DRAFT_840096 [Roridomyces roridus]|uniref:Uncharacterized protein n=1 Tax=Roridomyces roridus TaxID=1738132 RepID=A0AAD7FEP7_9AGAR|nr:hypothetical protein FB45DRAFT_840096 [Roridomyces roridus]
MSVNLVLPTLKNWAQLRLSAIIKATTPSAFDTAFDNFLSTHATLTVNGKHISRDEYKKQLQGEGFREAGASVTFNGAVEIPNDKSNTFQAGVVGLFYTAVISEKLILHGEPESNQITSSLNLVIEEDKSLTPPHLPSGVHGDFDGRRVSVLNQIILDVHQKNNFN